MNFAVNDIGVRIRELRVANHLSLSELALRSGVAKSYLSYIERGLQSNPSIEVLEKLCGALCIDIRVLLQMDNLDSMDDVQWLALMYQVQSLGLTKEQFVTFIRKHLARELGERDGQV